MHTGSAYVQRKKEEAYNPKNTLIKMFHCGDASVHLKLGIPSWWKESWKKEGYEMILKKNP